MLRWQLVISGVRAWWTDTPGNWVWVKSSHGKSWAKAKGKLCRGKYQEIAWNVDFWKQKKEILARHTSRCKQLTITMPDEVQSFWMTCATKRDNWVLVSQVQARSASRSLLIAWSTKIQGGNSGLVYQSQEVPWNSRKVHPREVNLPQPYRKREMMTDESSWEKKSCAVKVVEKKKPCATKTAR